MQKSPSMTRIWMSAVVALAVLMCSACAPEAVDTPETGDTLEALLMSMTPVSPTGDGGYHSYARDGALELLVDEAACTVAVRNTETGMLWESTPSMLDSDKIASKETKDKLRSLVEITYYHGTTAEKTLSGYADCVAKGQYEIYKGANSVLIKLTLGEGTGVLLNPAALSVETFEDKVLPKLDERSAARMKYFFKKRTLEEYSGDTRTQMLKKFPTLKENPLYICTALNKAEEKEVDRYMKQAGFTLETLKEEYRAISYEGEFDVQPSFVVPILFALQDGRLKVSLDTGHIQYSDEFYLHRITLLPYFGAANVSEEGFVLFPDGSGTIVGFNGDGKITRQFVTGKVYGPDMSAEEDKNIMIWCPLPLFGIRRGQDAMLAAITGSAADAYITVESGNISHSYTAVRATFGYLYKSSQDVYGSESGFMRYERKPYARRVMSLEYFFLSGQNAGLGGMAATYRALLEAEGMKPSVDKGELPLFLETLGAIQVKDKFLPWESSTVKLTDFRQDEKILKELSESGVGRIFMKLKGYANGGINHTAFARLEPVGALGGLEGLQSLVSAAGGFNAVVFPEINVSTVPREKMFSGFSATRDTARTLNGKISLLRTYDLVMGTTEDAEEKIILLNTRAAAAYAKTSGKVLDEVGAKGVSFGDIGRILSSDFGKSTRTPRYEAAENYTALLADTKRLRMVDYGNKYALIAADCVARMPMTDSQLTNYGQTVPFLQMVCFGSIEYASTPVNAEGDMTDALLRCIAFGASPYYQVVCDNLIKLRSDGAGTQYYHVGYDSLRQNIIDGYALCRVALSQVRGARMVDYRVSGNVSATVFDNGKTVWVNYGETDSVVGGHTVPARSYIVTDQQTGESGEPE